MSYIESHYRYLVPRILDIGHSHQVLLICSCILTRLIAWSWKIEFPEWWKANEMGFGVCICWHIQYVLYLMNLQYMMTRIVWYMYNFDMCSHSRRVMLAGRIKFYIQNLRIAKLPSKIDLGPLWLWPISFQLYIYVWFFFGSGRC